MKLLHVCGCSLSGLLTILAAATAAPIPKPADENAKAERLVRTLGAPSFKVREQAGRDLLQMGRAAYAALQAGMTDADAEVRQRCRRLFPVAFDLEMRARADGFANDSDPDNDHGLPGWHRFRALAGSERPARDLFARMVKADPALMDAVENWPKAHADERLMGRCLILQQTLSARDPANRTLISLADVAQLLFLGAHPDVTLSQAGTSGINNMLYQQAFQLGMKSGDEAPAVKKLLFAWLDHNIEDVNTAYTLANLLMTTQIKELVEPALKLATNKKIVPHVRANAMVAIGKVGKDLPNAKGVLARLEVFVKEDAVVSTFNGGNRIPATTQVGDVALAAMIRVAGQHPKDFGYPFIRNNPGMMDTYYYLCFNDDKERAAARKKWQDFWEAEQKKK